MAKKKHVVSSGQTAKKQLQAAADKFAALEAAQAKNGEQDKLRKMEALQAEVKQLEARVSKSNVAENTKADSKQLLEKVDALVAKNPLKVAAMLSQAAVAFQAGKKKLNPAVTGKAFAPVVKADDAVDELDDLSTPPAVIIADADGVAHNSVMVDSTVTLNDVAAPVVVPKNITPILAALQKELNRLDTKAASAHGIEGFFWKSTYKAKADTIRGVISGAELSDESIITEMDDSSSDLYKALNTHSSYVFQFSTNSYGLPVSTETRAVLHMKEAIEANKSPLITLDDEVSPNI